MAKLRNVYAGSAMLEILDVDPSTETIGSSSSSNERAAGEPAIDMKALAATNKDPPTIEVQRPASFPTCTTPCTKEHTGETLYEWFASKASPFVEPPVTASDPVDSINVKISTKYFLCSLPPEGLDGILVGTETGDVDLAASGMECVTTSSLDSSQPNLRNQAYLVEYRAVNSRQIPASPKRLVVVIADPCQRLDEFWCFKDEKCSVAGQCLGDDVGLDSIDTGTNSRALREHRKDKFSPRLTLRGSGRVAINRQGQAIMLDDISYGSTWTHPGTGTNYARR
ncbi:hypothetical protein VOLCADRAFT_91484 [Volvox carteri f. nagariensis]|uniref:Uncharacterized protein n=1 Tax=Volvox carteri f. nagariensis TaxID=3068 RepID=D8TX70_VOLCA|nr:uncharacterized protein VOLCADRAFT_91484 [Volvox carteri f. nagariensis]EFJ47856.1 hypothetical protein VOLCADRAFT_91484 [Volvox carteri f. nagariensis]|eukprot:XP_002950962.1 hypothetical protein VOLCADRAFT_91484 [Volvox carteri f. nagariensis]